MYERWFGTTRRWPNVREARSMENERQVLREEAMALKRRLEEAGDDDGPARRRAKYSASHHLPTTTESW
jgi:hypothetical protein